LPAARDDESVIARNAVTTQSRNVRSDVRHEIATARLLRLAMTVALPALVDA
jgi:hypothetical protein